MAASINKIVVVLSNPGDGEDFEPILDEGAFRTLLAEGLDAVLLDQGREAATARASAAS
jgi:hypothetical protein